MLRIVALLASLVAADADSPRRITVAVDDTIETDVGYAIGFICDDNKLVQAEMKNRSPTSNVFIVKGVAVGTTLCRAGTDPQRPSILFEVQVVPKRAAPKGRGGATQ